MTTPRDLMIIAMEVAPRPPVEPGDLSLALAGAELIDLLAAEAIRLDGDHIVPAHRSAIADRLLDEAASSLVREAPYESVRDWLWRRGRGLSSAYLAAMEADGQLTRQRRRGTLFRTSQMVLADSPDRRLATVRWTSGEPILATLAAAVGIGDKRTADSASVADDAVATVLAAANDALMELEAVRQRRAIEKAAFDNIWRGE
ncbi:GOLPH3/VPS74 family protein [Streptomyces sp. 6N223]|uniref:GOLPH3/VPS74 family protein n=1 Tax=Streptomyces sp. 6N223 TaxID=3457412 RepID=UPI003FD56279